MPSGVSKITRHFQVTIPSYIRKTVGLHEGDLIDFEALNSGEIMLKPVHMVKKSQAYYWTNKWQKGIKESEEALKRGEFEVFNNIDDAARSFARDKKNSNS